MIPSDVLTAQLRPSVQTDRVGPVQPAQPADAVNDLLSNLSAGQRITAEVLAVLPNGAYRAMIAQREVTLALPFSAKSGDALELEVVENDGKQALAVRVPASGVQPQESTPANLSSTAKLIASLFSPPEQGGGHGKAPLAQLNDAQPILNGKPLLTGGDLAPLLQQAVAKSGLFYEAHQAQWVQGQRTEAELRQEPQGKQLPLTYSPAPHTPANAAGNTNSPVPTAANNEILNSAAQHSAKAGESQVAQGKILAPETTNLVRQQLDSLASGNFVWQGQIWPGQTMEWRIEEEEQAPKRQGEEGEAAGGWKTSLRLHLPKLGTLDAQLTIQDNQLALDIATDSSQTAAKLGEEKNALVSQLAAAGLQITALNIREEGAHG